MSKYVFMVCLVFAFIIALPLQAQDASGNQASSGPSVVFPELFNRAADSANAGNYSQAVVDYTLFLLVNPTFSQAYFNRGLNYQALGNTDLALQDMAQALTYKQPSPQYTATIYYSRANLYLSQNDLNSALKDLNAAIQTDPNSADSYQVRARIYSFQGQFDQALADYDKLIQLQPDVAVNRVERGYVNSRLGNMEAALTDYSEAIQLSPDDPQVYAERAYFYASTSNLQSALTDISKAISLSPQTGDFYLLRGSLNTQAKNTVAAASDYLQWLTLSQTKRYTTDQVLTGNQQFTVTMGPGVTYAIPFQGSSGQSISVEASGQSGTQVDPLLVILDVNGNPLVADDDSAGNMNAAITGYVLPSDGQYTLVIGHAGGGGQTSQAGDVLVSVVLDAKSSSTP